uniref:Uncharacterized protein n=1 Tax=Lactuca sativa TaxID=4236 RepID=A0A9R1V6I4_LACSA|nr:hypothetical protein LSAT_V11C600324450 [Lactuca sativa]
MSLKKSGFYKRRTCILFTGAFKIVSDKCKIEKKKFIVTIYFYGNIKNDDVEFQNKIKNKPAKAPIKLRKKSKMMLKLKLKADRTPKDGTRANADSSIEVTI